MARGAETGSMTAWGEMIVPKGVAAHLSAPNQLTAYESHDDLLGNPLIEDRL